MTIREIIEREMATGFASFAGMEIRGSVPVKQELVNEFVTAFLHDATGPTPPTGSQDTPVSIGMNDAKARVSLSDLKRMVRTMNLRFVDGAMVVDFEVGR